MKTMEGHLSLWSNMFVLLAGSWLTPAEASMSTKPHVVRASIPQKLMYRVESTTLEGLKESLAQVNLHMRQNADRVRPEIRLALTGEGIVWFKKQGMDEELKTIVEWFQDEEVQIGVDQSWVHRLNLKVEDLSPGIVILNFQSSTPKED
ncbi:MAG: hypothetical protein G3M70_08615 [Candidatus Nitronauta litoralis]|uniref:Uncharacterized protein n=1 Tax=Candidatus Nitronauta litoralis TaxID=2705533 RepID=A0A7T0BVX7_9BACT|nr:MAG: hypothetical protein G3M70_08615 [Candidatus Nitronauta litoralis]